jgi:hypothetical protein
MYVSNRKDEKTLEKCSRPNDSGGSLMKMFRAQTTQAARVYRGIVRYKRGIASE